MTNHSSSLVDTKLASTKRAARLGIGEFSWIWVGLAILVAASAILAPGTLRPGSVVAMLPFAAMLAVVAVGQTIVIQQRGLDMSAAGIVSLAGLLVAKFSIVLGSAFLGVCATIVVCSLVGAVNGVLVARINISPIVATLATGALVMGVARLITDGSALPVPMSLQDVTHNSFAGIPTIALVALALVVLAVVLIEGTIIGRRYVAVGANPLTARSSGIVVIRYEIGTYMLAAACYSVAGILVAGFIGYASPTAGTDYLLPSIAAVVVGGTPFTGGKGSVVASAVAALFMSQLGQMVLALGGGPAQQLLVQALAIIIATSIRRLPFVKLPSLLNRSAHSSAARLGQSPLAPEPALHREDRP